MRVRKNIIELVIIIFLLFVCGILLFTWANKYTINQLETTRMSRAHQALYSLKPYFFSKKQNFFKKPLFSNFTSWMIDLEKNKIERFSLGYLIPAPFIFFLGDIPGFKLAHIIASLISCFFIYLIIRKHFKYSFLNAFFTLLILLSSYGFLFLSTHTVLDHFVFVFFFAFVYLYFKDKIFLAAFLYFLAVFSKDPRIILASAPAIIIFLLLFDNEKFKQKKNWFIFLLFSMIFLYLQSLSPGSSIDRFPFGFGTSKNSFQPGLFAYFKSINFNNLYYVFLTAPVLSTIGFLGIADLFNKKILKIEKLLLLTFISISLIYLSATTAAKHYIYFTFPFLALFASRYLKKLNIKSILFISCISLLLLSHQIKNPIYLKRLSLVEVESLRQELLPYSKDGYIISPGFDWGRYFHNKSYHYVWDVEWSDSIEDMPPYVVNNIGLLVLSEEHFPEFKSWSQSDKYHLIKVYDDYLFFAPKEDKALN